MKAGSRLASGGAAALVLTGENANLSKSEVKEIIDTELHITTDKEAYIGGSGKPDLIPFKKNKDGSFTLRKSYFYHNGYYSINLANDIIDAFKKRGFGIRIKGTDDQMKAWPKTSYLEAVFEVTK